MIKSEKWISKNVYEHPAKHRAGTYGHVILSSVDIYYMHNEYTALTCPQIWAAGIHKKEEIENDEKIKGRSN